MSPRTVRLLISLSGIAGTLLLASYFGVGFAIGLAQLPPNASLSQVVALGIQYHDAWFLGAWLQATGSLLSIIFFLGLVHEAKAIGKLSGTLTVVGATTLMAVVLIEGVMTMDLAQAAINGHQVTSLTSFDIMTVFTHIYPIVPAPLIFLALGYVLLQSHILPRFFTVSALTLGSLFLLAGFISLFVLPWLVLVVLSLQAFWVVGAAISLLLTKREILA
jgi:hypothetical protein